MQMIDVLKRLAELDADNPNVAQPTMTAEQSLATVSNVEGQLNESVNECGPMGMSPVPAMPRTPASFSINASAESGDEVANMLTQIMNLAGVKPVADLPAFAEPHKEIELGEPHSAEFGGDEGDNDSMADMIGMIDRLNGPTDGAKEPESDDTESKSPVADMADEVEGMADELADVNDGYDNSPEEEIKAHAYGDDQVTPKPQGLKQRLGDNPYTPVGESVEQVSLDLLKAYEAFKNGQ